jgi:hypothetical protein
MNPLRDGRHAFDQAALYSITVQGRIDEDWADRLGGMAVTVFIGEGGSPVTTLVGELRDQASLSGVLDTLYALHLPVLSVQRLSAG